MNDQILLIPGASPWLNKTIEALNAGRPLYRGKMVDPFLHPDKPRNKQLHEWLRTDAPEDLKGYCRESLRFYREHKELAPDWYRRLEAGLK